MRGKFNGLEDNNSEEQNVEPIHDFRILNIDTDLVVMLIQFCKNALIQRYSQMDLMGKVYIDPALKRYKAPMSQRKNLKIVDYFGGSI